MSKYHFSPKIGELRICRAKPGNCIYGDVHFDSPYSVAALKYEYEERKKLNKNHDNEETFEEYKKRKQENKIDSVKRNIQLTNILNNYESINKEKPQVKIRQIGDLYTANYLHGGVDFSNKYIRCSGGLTFDKDDNIYLRGYEKFFNYLQIEERENYDEDFKEQFSRIQKSDKINVREKKDGTLILVGEYNGKLLVGTKSSIDNDFTQLVKPMVNNIAPDIAKHLKGYTLTMEYISPDNRIGVTYDETKLVLLHVIDNKTGTRYEGQELDKIINYPNVFDLPETNTYSLEELLELQKTKKNFEGWVVINDYGNLVKFKTEDWYKEKGKYETIFFPRKITKNVIENIYQAYRNNTVDDLLAYKNQFHTEASYIDDVVNYIEKLQDRIDFLNSKYKDDYRNLAQEEMGSLAINYQKNKDSEKFHRQFQKYLFSNFVK